jgi:L-amino acid N-acyltransferase YncA
MDYAIEPLYQRHWEQVREIYLEGIATRNATFETEAPGWWRWDAAHLPFGRLVACASNEVLGWAALSPVSARHCYRGVAEVSVYVRSRRTRQGIGQALLRSVIEASEQNGVWTLQAGIFPENLVSLGLVKKCGFREIGRRERPAQLDGVWRDVILLERRSKTVGT